MKVKAATTLLLLLVFTSFNGLCKELKLYAIDYFTKASDAGVNFISLTDGFRYSEHPDSIVIAANFLGDLKIKNYNYHRLSAVYRTRFLNQMGITESDLIFLYDFTLDTVVHYKVRDVPLAAHLNILGSNKPLTALEYHIGFELGQLPFSGKEYDRSILVYVGTKSPFLIGTIKALAWRETAATALPESTLGSNEAAKDATYSGKLYVAQADGYRYTLQRITTSYGLRGYHLLVTEVRVGFTVLDHCFIDTESTYLHSLNFVNNDHVPEVLQWTGKLFKDYPPMIFGLMGATYGCDAFYFLDPAVPPLGIHCDNRY